MPKKYLVLNFSDYKHRTTPILNLNSTFARRVQKKGGSFVIYNMADMFAGLRLILDKDLGHHPVEGLLDLPTIQKLYIWGHVIGMKWRCLMTDCIGADKIIFAAHGRKDDTDNIFCEDSMTNIRCGNVSGVNFLLSKLLEMNIKTNITVTLVVCFAARSEEHTKHHVNDELTEMDIRSALAYKLFVKLSKRFNDLRLTARTGATSASNARTSLLSQTEEAIIASETRRIEFPGTQGDDLIGETMQAVQLFDTTLLNSNLTLLERQELSNSIYEWFTEGCRPNKLEEIIDDISELDDTNKSAGLKLLECLCCCCCIKFSWLRNNEDTLDQLRLTVERYYRLFQLNTASQEKLEKYGKFIYQKEEGRIIVSRWFKIDEEYQLVQLYRIIE